MKYKISFSTPNGQIDAEANSVEAMDSLLFNDVADLIKPVHLAEKSELDLAVEDALQKYQEYKNTELQKHRQTSMEIAGIEADVIRCYLSSMTIVNTMKWVKMKRGTQLSKTAIGRFFRVLFDLKIYRLKLQKNNLTDK